MHKPSGRASAKEKQIKSAETDFKATVVEVGTCGDLLVMEPTGTIFGALSLKCYTGGCAGPTHAIARLGEPSVTHPLLQAPKSQFGQVSHLSPSTMCRDQTATGVGEHPQIPSGAGVKQQLGSVST